MTNGRRIEVEILFAAFEQKDCNVKPEQKLNKDLMPTAPNSILRFYKLYHLSLPILHFVKPVRFVLGHRPLL